MVLIQGRARRSRDGNMESRYADPAPPAGPHPGLARHNMVTSQHHVIT